MHELMHFLVESYFWAYPLGTLLFAVFGGILGFAFANQKRVWSLSGLITALVILLIPWSFLVERGHSLAPLAYFAIIPTILIPYWLVLGLVRLLSRQT